MSDMDAVTALKTLHTVVASVMEAYRFQYLDDQYHTDKQGALIEGKAYESFDLLCQRFADPMEYLSSQTLLTAESNRDDDTGKSVSQQLPPGLYTKEQERFINAARADISSS